MFPAMEGQAVRAGQPAGLPRGGPCKRQEEEGQTSQARVRGWPHVRVLQDVPVRNQRGEWGRALGKKTQSTWLARWVKHQTPRSQGHMFKPHIERKAYTHT